VAIHLELCKEQIERIVGFLGYGNPAGSVWFVGIEEGLGKANSNDALINLSRRGQFAEIMDLYDAHHRRLWERGQLIDFDVKPPSTPAWQWMAKIMCACDGEDWKEYVKCSLGRRNGETFLAELSPIPSRDTRENKVWFEAFEERFTELGAKLHKHLENRKNALLRLLQEERPRLVICYGDGEERSCNFAKFFDLEWTLIGERIKKGSKHSCPFLLLPFFGQGQMKQSVLEEVYKRNLIPVPST
jgi:hypothetical protein